MKIRIKPLSSTECHIVNGGRCICWLHGDSQDSYYYMQSALSLVCCLPTLGISLGCIPDKKYHDTITTFDDVGTYNECRNRCCGTEHNTKSFQFDKEEVQQC
jgi:hypothetical protein